MKKTVNHSLLFARGRMSRLKAEKSRGKAVRFST